MSTRGTILLAIGMLVLGLLLGGLSGGIAGYAMGQNAQPQIGQVIPPMMQRPRTQTTPQPSNPFGNRGFPPAQNVLGGVQIESVEKDSPAEKAGLKVDDIITAVGSAKLDAQHSLADLIQAKKPGDKVELSITRGTQTLMLTAELGAATDDKSKAWLGIRYSTVPGGRRFPNG